MSVISGGMGVLMLSENRSDHDAYMDLAHPSIVHFVNCMAYLKNLYVIVPGDVHKRPRSLTTKSLHGLYREHAPQAPLSQSQCYRFDHGQAAPSIIEVYEFASIFNVSPQIFLPAVAHESAVHLRLRPRYPQSPRGR